MHKLSLDGMGHECNINLHCDVVKICGNYTALDIRIVQCLAQSFHASDDIICGKMSCRRPITKQQTIHCCFKCGSTHCKSCLIPAGNLTNLCWMCYDIE